MIFQTTLKRSVEIAGIGLHTGCQITMKLRPATSGTGIVFHRIDGPLPVSIEAVSANVVDTRMATVIGRDGLIGFHHRTSHGGPGRLRHRQPAHRHRRAGSAGHGRKRRPSSPTCKGRYRQLPHRRKYLAIRKPITVVDGEKRVSLIPSRFFRISFDIAFDHPCIGQAAPFGQGFRSLFRKDLASARTFGFLREVEYLKANGLARAVLLKMPSSSAMTASSIPKGCALPMNSCGTRSSTRSAISACSAIRSWGISKRSRPAMISITRPWNNPGRLPDCWQLVEFGGPRRMQPTAGIPPIAPWPMPELELPPESFHFQS
jgi:hypothetical protein